MTEHYCGDRKRRIEWMKKLCHMFQVIISEITYKKADMPDSFLFAADRTDAELSEFLLSVCEEWKKKNGTTLHEIWAQKVEECFTKTYIKKTDLEQLTHLGEQIGYQDREMQISILRLYTEELFRSIEESVKTYTEVKRISRVAGVFAGAVIVVLLI